MDLMKNLDFKISQLNDEAHFQSVKMTFVDLVPFLVGVGMIYICQKFLNILFIKSFLMMVELLYCVFVNVLYTIHFTKLHKINNSIYVLFSFLLSFMYVYTDQTGDSLRLTLPILIVNMISIDIICFIEKFHFSISFIPTLIEKYVIQLVPIVVSIILLLISVYLQNFYILYFIDLIQFVLNFCSSVVGILIITIFTCYFWYKGIHGVSVIGTILRPFWMQMTMVNLMCILNHQELIYIGTEGFFQWFVWIGGSGATIGLSLLCRFFAKSLQLKELGKNSLRSSFLNVNEEMIFGVPIVGNQYMKIPFFLAPIFNAIVTYTLMYLGYIDKTFLISPWMLPSIIGGFWATGGQFTSVLFIILLIVISVFIYLPFFTIYDNSLKRKEMDL